MEKKDLSISKAWHHYERVIRQSERDLRTIYRQSWRDYNEALKPVRQAYREARIKAWEAMQAESARATERGKGAEAAAWKAFIEAGLGKSLEDIQKEANGFVKQGGRIKWEEVK